MNFLKEIHKPSFISGRYIDKHVNREGKLNVIRFQSSIKDFNSGNVCRHRVLNDNYIFD